MGLSIYNIKRWYLMMTGKSIYHVNQGLGQVIDKGGYYNDMTQKVLMAPDLLESEELPLLTIESGEKVEFPVAIFQYGLGAYDLYLKTGEKKYYAKFFQCCRWALKNQQANGAWSNFFYCYPNHPYGAMCQGEGISLLLRGYVETKNEIYREVAQKAMCFMIVDISEGGCTEYNNDEVILREYTHHKAVLNGWIFALFGIYDYNKLQKTDSRYIDIYERVLNTLIKYMPRFTKSYWSMYDLEGRIASPFYHHLHVAQMNAMYEITGEEVFNEYAKRWEKQEKNIFCKSFAFCIKAIQKIKE